MERKIIHLHLTFWASYILLGVLYNVASHHQLRVTPELYLNDLLHPFTWIGYGRTIIVCYISLWCFNMLFSIRLYYVSIAAVLGLILFDVCFRYLIEQLLIGPIFRIWQFPRGIPFSAYFMETVFYSAIGIFLSFVLKIINDYFVSERIYRERILIELQFLKSQINPHFLFNSFNSLYGLSLSEPDRTPDAILKMAELTRYMLLESNEAYLPLSKEISYLQNLIEVQRLRYGSDFYLHFQIEGQENDPMIAPLLLIAFVENAFKHGELNDPERPVIIQLKVSATYLHLNVKNFIKDQQKDETGGIGLKNVKRRLELIYPGKYTLSCEPHGRSYEADLTLKLL